GGAAAENLTGRGQLDVHLKTDDRLVLRDHFWRSEFRDGRRHLNYYRGGAKGVRVSIVRCYIKEVKPRMAETLRLRAGAIHAIPACRGVSNVIPLGRYRLLVQV